jgi:hypothetical protein
MSLTLIILVVAVVAVIAAALAARGGGPRVTTIERRTEHKKDGNDA